MRPDVIALGDFVHDGIRGQAGRHLTDESGRPIDESLAFQLQQVGLVRIGRAEETSAGKRAGRWAGCTVVCIASGPSLSVDGFADVAAIQAWRAEDQRNRKVIAICTTFRNAPWADAIYASDARWWRVYGPEALRSCSGELWSSCDQGGGHRAGNQEAEWARVPATVRSRLNWIEVADKPGLSTIAGLVHSGSNSGYATIGLVEQWGADPIVLLGYDMQRTFGKTHHHGDHEGNLPNLGKLDEWVLRMGPLATDLQARGKTVINATRHTALKCFERASIADALHVKQEGIAA